MIKSHELKAEITAPMGIPPQLLDQVVGGGGAQLDITQKLHVLFELDFKATRFSFTNVCLTFNSAKSGNKVPGRH